MVYKRLDEYEMKAWSATIQMECIKNILEREDKERGSVSWKSGERAYSYRM